MPSNVYVARVQSPCCSTEREVWTVRANSKANAKRRIEAYTNTNVYEVSIAFDSPKRHQKCW